MNPIIENFMERPTWQKAAFWVVSLVFVSFVGWQYFCVEKSTQINELEQKKEKLNTEIAFEQRLAKNLPRFREEAKELEIKLKFALQELPDKREIPELLSSISNLARDAGLEVSLFKPQPENFKEFYAEVPVAVSVEGSYHQVATFFEEVGQLPRVVNINQIAMKEPKQGENGMMVKTTCMATTFRYLDEAERAAHATSDDAKKSTARRRK